MKFSLHVPVPLVIDGGAKGASALKTVVQAAEAAGFDGCDLTDHPAPTASWRYNMGGHDALDPFAALAFVAAVTTRLHLLTHILVLPYRNPFLTAKGVATLDLLCEGRLIVGVAAGYLEDEFKALGVDFASRNETMNEAVTVMKRAWSGERVAFEGRRFTADDILPRPLPVQKPHPPIWGGGNSTAAIRWAAEHCDGWSPFFVSSERATSRHTKPMATVEDLAGRIEILRRDLEAVGRTRPFDICAGLPTPLTNCDTANARMLLDAIGRMTEIGVTWMEIPLPEPNLAAMLDNIQWFSEEVLKKFRPTPAEES